MDHIQNIAKNYRSFLEKKWLEIHKSHNEPIPTPLSKFMCRYTCLYLKKQLLIEHDISSTIVIGRPDQDKDGTQHGLYGFCDEHKNWHDHTWLIIDNHILDITADQFGAPQLIWSGINDPRYSANNNQQKLLEEMSSLYHRIENW